MNDLIDREQAIKRLLNIKERNIRKQQILAADEDGIIEWLNALPSAEKTGEWIEASDLIDNQSFSECKCSECGAVEYFNKGWKRFNYCPNCGARME